MKTLLLTIVLLISGLSMHAQGFKISAMGGTAAYLGDLQEDIWNQPDMAPSISLSAAYYFKDIIGLRASFTTAHVSGDDALSPVAGLRARNLHFRSDIYEVALMAEIDLTGWTRTAVHPYLFGGVAGFHFNPQALYNGEWVDLQPLGTEGQGTSAHPNRKPYALYQFALPVGAGIRFDLGRDWQLGVEATYRKTFTDYLDDVSIAYPDLAVLAEENGALAAELSFRGDEVNPNAGQPGIGSKRGNPLMMDTYLTGGIVLTKRLGRNVKRPARYGRGYGCPSAQF